MRKLLLLPVFLIVYVLAGGPTAFAHSGKQSYVYLDFFDTELEGRVEIPVRDLGAVLGIDFGAGAETIMSAFDANQADVVSYVDAHLALESMEGETWDLEYGDVTLLDLGPSSYLLFPFAVTDEFDETPRQLVIDFDAIIEADPEKDALLHIENDVRSGVLNNESDPILGFSTGQTVQTLVLDDASTLTQLGALRGLGTDAVRNGVVHVLFVGVLMAPIALLARRRNFGDPAPSNLAVIKRACAALAAFGGGAVVTLSFTGLGVIDLSSRVVVAATAISLLAMSLWAVLTWRRPSVTAREVPVIAVLGLLQGLGFGATFVNDDLDRSRAVLSLLGFTIGVAAGVVIVAALALLPLVLLRRTPLAPGLLVIVAGVGALYAGVWILNGLLDADWTLDEFVNPWRVWPRNLVLAVVGIAAAAGLRAVFVARGSMRPIGQASDPSNEPSTDSETMVNV